MQTSVANATPQDNNEWFTRMVEGGAVPMRHTTPIKRYATFRPDTNGEAVLYGEATLVRGYGYLFQQDGCDWTLPVHYSDMRLIVGALVTEDGPCACETCADWRHRHATA